MSRRNEMKSIMKIVLPGPLTTVQDSGRHGHMAEGFPVCGAADTDSMETANILVGNKNSAAVLEITMGGFSAVLCCDRVIAATGAEAKFLINGNPSDMYRAYKLKQGDYIYFDYASAGCRIYLAVSGGFDVDPVMESRSTFLKTALGGFRGRKLESGDELPLVNASLPLPCMEKRAVSPVKYKNSVVLRAVLGPQDDMFPLEEIDKLFSSEYKVSPASDRMGLRLEGPALTAINGTDIISDGIACGSVQIPRDGKPIILGADRQTVGGYAKPVTVISADMPKVGQLIPGNTVRFVRISADEAVKIAVNHKKEIEKLNKKLNGK